MFANIRRAHGFLILRHFDDDDIVGSNLEIKKFFVIFFFFNYMLTINETALAIIAYH